MSDGVDRKNLWDNSAKDVYCSGEMAVKEAGAGAAGLGSDAGVGN